VKVFRHPETNRTFDPPPGFDYPQLPAVNTEFGQMTFWKPTWRERLRVLFGWPVRLTVAGFVHPPVYLDTENLE
jgi:hypothetical protein